MRFRLLFFLAVFLIFLLPPTDPDLGWQLRCGQLIWQHQGFCSQNQFSVLLGGYHWANHHWLYQAMIWGIWGRWGLWGLTIFNALLVAGAFFFFYLAIENWVLEKILAVVLTIIFGWGVFALGLRSQLLGIFYFNFLLWLASHFKKRPRLVFLIPLVMLFWANSHGGSVILGLVLIAGLFSLIRPIRGIWFIIGGLSVGATLLNPFGLGIYTEAWRHFAVVPLNTLIAEWTPPPAFLWWFILLTSLSIFLLCPFAFFLFPFTFLALKARRNIPFFFFLSFYLLFAQGVAARIYSAERKSLAWLLVFVFLLFGFFVRLPLAFSQNSSWQSYCQASSLNYPCRAVEFLQKQAGGGNIFNRYEWGGFLIWQLSDYKIFVDGRMPAWVTPSGKSPYTVYLETLQTQPGWQETLKDYNINWILISPGTFMDLLLSPNPEKFGWQEVFRNETSVVYKRKGITS